MKTLDEVIKALEICWEQGTCNKECPYMMAEPSCGLRRELDALHYLKEYRETKKHLACLDDAEIRGDNTQVVNNPPLSWQELQQMTGKPVWVELLYHHPEQKYKYWDVIKRFDAVEGYDLIDLAQTGYLYKSLLNREWQAFRKGRHESTDSN